MKRPDGVTIIAIVFFLWATLCFLGALIVGLFGIPAILWSDLEGTPLYFPIAGISLVIFLLLVCGAVDVVAGWGLLSLRGWARWLATIVCILSLLAFPIGTILGGLIIWYLMREDVVKIFDEQIAV